MPIASILLVEDDELFARGLESKLAVAGYSVSRAMDGREALRFYDPQKVSVVLTDLIWSEKESLELIAELRRMNPAVKIIAMASGALVSPHSYFSRARHFGATGTLLKPFSVDELFVVIQSVLRN